MAFYWWCVRASVWALLCTHRASSRTARIDFYLLLMFHHTQTIHLLSVWCFLLSSSSYTLAILAALCFMYVFPSIYVSFFSQFVIFSYSGEKMYYHISKRAIRNVCTDNESKIDIEHIVSFFSFLFPFSSSSCWIFCASILTLLIDNEWWAECIYECCVSECVFACCILCDCILSEGISKMATKPA